MATKPGSGTLVDMREEVLSVLREFQEEMGESAYSDAEIAVGLFRHHIEFVPFELWEALDMLIFEGKIRDKKGDGRSQLVLTEEV